MGSLGKLTLAALLALVALIVAALVVVAKNAHERNRELESALSTCLVVLDAFKKNPPP